METHKKTKLKKRTKNMVASNTAINTAAAENEFGFDESFESKRNEGHPFAQLINPSMPISDEEGNSRLQPYGLAIRLDNAEKVGLTSTSLTENGWEEVDYKFTSGSEKLWMTRKPRFVIVKKTPVFVLDKSTKRTVGKFDEKVYNNLLHKTFTEAFILILGKNNELLHSIPEGDEFDPESEEALPMPLKIKLGGAGGTRFGVSYRSYDRELKLEKGFIAELELAYAQLRGEKKPKKMNSIWYAHGIFAPTITSKPAGTPPNVKDVCDFSRYEVPTPEKLGQNLIKGKTELSKLIIAIHNKYEQYTPKIGSTNLDILDDVEEFGTATSGRPKVPASAYMAGTQVTAKIEVSDADMPPY
ncbi:MAG: hypothetical protein AN484_11540 [Aphanizomenon flos-aquae WA102]|uniref:DUF5895 domain-containing protein n=1 Tax=Aphanizomenon flos-aquae WA102 TaxID=1710896 RepID=A0A1B7X2Q2_APHFL|nr:MAG: hypothetical protein AN484_11540 [Aphanizomenon flos-aquae WA102]